jgi:hypothetical protein
LNCFVQWENCFLSFFTLSLVLYFCSTRLVWVFFYSERNVFLWIISLVENKTKRKWLNIVCGFWPMYVLCNGRLFCLFFIMNTLHLSPFPFFFSLRFLFVLLFFLTFFFSEFLLPVWYRRLFLNFFFLLHNFLFYPFSSFFTLLSHTHLSFFLFHTFFFF